MDLLVIAKEPVPGRSKTRLTPPLTPEQAAALAEAALADTLETVAQVKARRRILVLDGSPGDWLPAGFDVVPQADGGLDSRLAAAFSATRGPALLIGMDTPQITVDLLESAIGLLGEGSNDAVLGPAEDGGWWAIGLVEPSPDIFEGLPMSTEETCAAQIARLDSLGLGWAELPTLRDFDLIEDARAVASENPDLRFSVRLREIEATWTPAV
ncbi:MAG: TIGR04282 family arsenosugar biosynthesis glycosyltransferase [Solirubrobacterales bacterium]